MKKIVVILFSCLIALGISSCVFAQSSDDVISYEQLVKYKWLFDRESGPATEGRVPVKIEAVIGAMDERNENSNNDGFDMWIKGENGYNLVHQEYYWWNHYDEPFPETPLYGQRIIYEIKPYSDGQFFGSSIISYKVLENNVNIKAIEKEYALANWSNILTYEKYEELPSDYDGLNPVLLEVVIGDVVDLENNTYKADLWIKGEKGYTYINEYAFLHNKYLAPIYGQRVVYRLTKDILLLGNNLKNKFIIEENVDVKEIERTYLASLENDVRSKLVETKEEKDFFPLTSYKKLLRNIEKESGAPILLTGKVLQEFKDGSFLLCDDDNNYYNIYILKNFKDIREEIIDFNILEDDHIKVYGYVNDKLYTYDTWSGKKKVPTIIAKKVILLDDE